MSLRRCAVCGSSNLVTESKQEGYNKKKGIMGMALFGLGGAVAGASGNTVVYYHCADCGHTLNRTMPSDENNLIEEYLLNRTQRNLLYLRAMKKKYPNLDWEESPEETAQINEAASMEVAIDVFQAVCLAGKPCRREDIGDTVFCKNYASTTIHEALMMLCKKNVLSREIIKMSAYYTPLVETKSEALSLLQLEDENRAAGV